MTILLRAALLALLLPVLTLPAWADSRLGSGDWPTGDALNAIEALPVRFPSSSPFTPRDIGTDSTAPTEAIGHLFLPPEGVRASGAKHPAVVLIHGAGGVQPAREMTYGRQFAAMGIVALVVDSFAARRDLATGFTQRLLEITETMLVADLYAGMDFLAERPEVDEKRIALVGFSYGGMAATFALNEGIAEALATKGRRFAGHVSFYGPCIARFAQPRTTGAPYLMLYGTEDALIDPVRCAQTVETLKANGSKANLIAYDGAYHQWDGGWGGPRKVSRNLVACAFNVSETGLVRDDNTWIPMLGAISRRLILASCVDESGYLIGADSAVREKSNREVGRFLMDIFGFAPTGQAG